MREKHVDAVVVGAGLAGLTTAASLAALGWRVTVLEQYTVVGGSTHVFRRKGKWEWQVGVHHLADCGLGGDMPTTLRALGIGRDQIAFRRMDDSGFERFVFPDLVFDTPTDWGLWERRLVDAFPHERKKIERLLSAVKHVGAAVDRGPTSSSIAGLAKSALRMGPYAAIALLSLKQVLDLFGLSPRLRTLISVSPCGSLNAPPSRLPFAAFASYYRLFIEGGSWFPQGGGQMLSSSLLQVLEYFGGEVITGEFVEQIRVDGGAVRGVTTKSGRTYHTPIVVSTADIKKTYNDLIPHGAVPASKLKRVNGYRMSHAFFNAFLGVDVDLTQRYPNRDHFSMPTWKGLDELNDLAAFRPTDTAETWLDRVTPILPGYVHCSNLKDPGNTTYSPPGSSSLEVMFPIECDYRVWGAAAATERAHDYRSSGTYQQVKECITDAMVDRAQAVFPEIKGHVVHREAATPLTQERFTQSTLGSAYGIELSTRQVAAMRPGPKTSIRGLFLAGASCRPGPTTEGVLLSGVQTAGVIVGRDLQTDFAHGRYLVAEGMLPAIDVSSWDPLDKARGGAAQDSASSAVDSRLAIPAAEV